MKAMTTWRGGSRARPCRGTHLGQGGHKAYFMTALLLVLAAGTIAVYAQAGGYDLTWNTVDGGGATLAGGGGYTLSGTAGQPDAATWTGGGYTLAGGFWHAGAAGGTTPGDTSVYLPIIVRNR